MNEPDFLTVEDVLALHARSLERFGGGAGIRDVALLESAVAVPQSSFAGQFAHANLFEMAAACAFHIAQNQPFVDGNKRGGLGSALLFLKLNAIDLDDPEGRLYDARIGLAERWRDSRALHARHCDLNRKWGLRNNDAVRAEGMVALDSP